ncbi:nidogen-like domain-containing protein [Hymenobacter rubripertinctus]|uniref:T9SS C-terminal target domain-containing protein n=1 Tax=Hymenobacter rubripertinctus TaxID=2029981 RepID=A0A418QN64_9BACT|nr:nidogen-like domain-containing protein [Hymenobacter rubripertinctus]RIY06538.1 T9SS C-terminal target domain-containing protein [Hymenobacter rubripertinctus]
MRTFSLVVLCRWMLVLCLTGTFGQQAFAQAVPAHSLDPSLLDPQYDARKQSLIRTSARPQPAGRPAAGGRTTALQLPACFEPLDSVSAPAAGGYINLARNDDGSSNLIPLGFTFTLFGTPYTGVYINTNGNLSFGTPVSQYSADGFPINTPMVAGFWADVDTRPSGSGSIWYKIFPDRLVVTWNRVGYYQSNTTKKNTFQIVIRANSSGVTTDDVTFAYGDMQWTTGDASGGTNGFGGSLATVGNNRGTNGDFIQTGRFNLNNATHPDNVSPSGVDWLDQQCISYRVFADGNLPPSATNLPLNNTITVNQGQTVSIAPQFSGPEAGQTVTLAVNTNGLCNVSSSVSTGINPVLNLSVTGAACNVGTSTISVVATDNGTPVASRQFDITVIVNPPAAANGQWTGSTSTVYTDPTNWTNNTLPTGSIDVTIPASAVRMPVLSAAAAANSFTVASGASLTIANDGLLTLNGTLLNNGSFGGTGTLVLGGSARQSLGGNTLISVGGLTVGSAGGQLTGPLAVSRLLTLNGSLATNSQTLTLLSDAAGTAMVANNGSAVVTGAATVQRYINPSQNAGAGYRHYSAPVSNTTVADLATANFTPVVNPDYNTAPVPAAVTPFPTVFGYDENRVNAPAGAFDQGWFSPASQSAPLTPGVGYTVNLPATATVDFVGTLTNGPVARTGLTRGTEPASGWHLLGNPYPAPIDWTLAAAGLSGLDNAVYVFKSSGTYAGSYSSFVNGIGDARFIAMGQGFFVRATAPGTPGSLLLSNAARVTTYQNPAFNRTPELETRPLLQLDLVTGTQRDAATVYFEQGATPGFDTAFDAYKLTSGNVASISLPAGSEQLSISGLPALNRSDVLIPLQVRVAVSGSYQLEAIRLLNLPAGLNAYLRDAETGVSLDLTQQPVYSFRQTADATGPRFSVLLTTSRLLASAAALAGQQIQLYPNPAHTAATLVLPAALRNQMGTAVLYNALGQAVRSYSWLPSSASTTQVLSVSGLAQGVYTLRLATIMGPVTKRLVIE